MTYIDFMPMPGKKNKNNYAESVATGRNQSRAHKALYDMVVFNEAIEHDIQGMLASSAHGQGIDKDLLAKMITVKEKYLIAMQGIQEYDDQKQHLALIIYADAVQDVINHINKRKKH